MITSIATIAGAITALIGVGYGIYASIKRKQDQKRVDDGRSIEQQILEAKTNEERAKLAAMLSDHDTH